jgi:uncharacterized membrane protein
MQRTPPKLADYVICYALFIVLIVLCYATFQIWRITLQLGFVTIFGQSYGDQFLYSILVLLIGIALFVLIIVAEPYLRGGLRRRQVLPRFLRLAVPVGIAIAIGLVLHQVL